MGFLVSLIGILMLGLLPELALADGYSVANSVVHAMGLGFIIDLSQLTTMQCEVANGACGFVDIAGTVVVTIRPLILTIAGLMIVIMGIKMIIAQDDEAINKAKTMISACISGVILSFVIEPFIAAFYSPTGGLPQNGPQIVQTQVMGVINWALVIIAALAVTILVVQAFIALTTPLSEESITTLRKTIFSIVIGILLLGFKEVIVVAVGATGAPSPIPAIAALVKIISFFLGFLALAATVVVCYAGISLILNFGNEEAFTKSKSLIIRAVIGLVVVLVSLAIVQFVIATVTG